MHNTDAGPCTAIAVGARNSRSQNALAACEINVALADTGLTPVTGTEPGNCVTVPVMTAVPALSVLQLGSFAEALLATSGALLFHSIPHCARSEERRVGTACVSTVRSGWWPCHSKKKHKKSKRKDD